MLLAQHIAADGRRRLRLGSVAPLVLAPLVLLAPIDRVNFDATWSDNVEQAWPVFRLLIGVVGLALRCLTAGFVPIERIIAADMVLAGQPFRQWLVADMKWAVLFVAAICSARPFAR